MKLKNLRILITSRGREGGRERQAVNTTTWDAGGHDGAATTTGSREGLVIDLEKNPSNLARKPIIDTLKRLALPIPEGLRHVWILSHEEAARDQTCVCWLVGPVYPWKCPLLHGVGVLLESEEITARARHCKGSETLYFAFRTPMRSCVKFVLFSSFFLSFVFFIRGKNESNFDRTRIFERR